MKPFAFSPSRRLAVTVPTGLCLLVMAVGCGRANLRPASSLSPQDKTTLDQYEQIRVALAQDDLKAAKASAGAMAASLQSADPKGPGAAALGPASDISTAPAIDRARMKFKQLSAKVIPLAHGVEGYYVLTCPVLSAGDWLQHSASPDNPYFGRAMHDYGDLKK